MDKIDRIERAALRFMSDNAATATDPGGAFRNALELGEKFVREADAFFGERESAVWADPEVVDLGKD